MGSLVTLLGLISSGMAVYQFEYVNPKVSMEVPGIDGIVSFHVLNDSYVDLRHVESICFFRSIEVGTTKMTNAHLRGLMSQKTDMIPAGTSKIAPCGVVRANASDPVTITAVDFDMSARTRCLPFLAVCLHSFHYYFQCVPSESGPHCLEGDNFGPQK